MNFKKAISDSRRINDSIDVWALDQAVKECRNKLVKALTKAIKENGGTYEHSKGYYTLGMDGRDAFINWKKTDYSDEHTYYLKSLPINELLSYIDDMDKSASY